MTAPVGALVRLFYDSPIRVSPGDALRTGTGRLYEIVSVRVQERGKHAGRRQHLVCLVAREAPMDARIHFLRWYPRNRRGGRWKGRWAA